MGRYWLGCSGWAYDDWVGPFYPPGTPPGEFLERYARVFRTVEVDSSFYRAPGPFLVRRWVERTPADFRFALKVPRDVTHEEDERKGDEVLAGFLGSLSPLRAAGKLAAVVLQFPASFRAPAGAGRLEHLLTSVPVEIPLAVELRHSSWWVPGTRRMLDERRAALVWSVVPGTEPPAWIPGPFVYARFVGDRALTKFDRLQRDRGDDLTRMRARFEDEARSADPVYAYANNHFMGYGPGTVAAIATALGEPAPDLGAAQRGAGQRTLAAGVDAAERE
ncbi:MAG TPA: DUF72 domain-containing protein [Thermoplasmata archaeon]|nr:DUF72 domain-containing protein [Thermoplasmata archaeon]